MLLNCAMPIVMEYASRFFRTGKRGRPRIEPHKPVTIDMNCRIHTVMKDYCVKKDISQREFIELAAEMLVINNEFAERVKARRLELKHQLEEHKLL